VGARGKRSGLGSGNSLWRLAWNENGLGPNKRVKGIKRKGYRQCLHLKGICGNTKIGFNI
jgi:hypothetical protein